MPTISKIRFVNVVYEKGMKRYNDSTFLYDGHNGVIILENGAGKTVYIQAALQAILPHVEVGKRKVRNTFSLEGEAMHVAIEWLISDKPKRHYAVTAVTLYLQDGELKSHKYVYEYGPDDLQSIDHIPFVYKNPDQTIRAASKGEIGDYYGQMSKNSMLAKTFQTTKDFHEYIEERFKIIPDEWRSIARINGEEGGIEAYFDGCNTTAQLVEKLLIPSVEQAINEEGKVNFAETFESHREHVKKYQELKKVIEESKKVKERMKAYVDQMTLHHNYEKVHKEYLSQAKSLYQLIEKRVKELVHKLSEVEVQEDLYREVFKKLEQDKALCQLTDLYHEMQNKEEEWLKEQIVGIGLNEEYEKKTKEYTLLKIAEKQTQVSNLLGEIQGLKRELDLLDEEMSIQALKDELEENGGALHGLYYEKLQGYEKAIKSLLYQKEREEEEEKDLEKRKRALESSLEEHKKISIKLETQIGEKDKSSRKIEKELVGEESSVEIATEKRTWEQEIANNEEQLVQIEESVRKSKREKGELDEEIRKTYERIKTLEKQESEKRTQKDAIEGQEAYIVSAIKERIPSYAIDRLYTKQEQILETLNEKIRYLEQEKEDYLVEERKLSRFLDFYKGHQTFLVEPLLEELLEKWQSQFEYLVGGATYIEALCKNENWTIEDCYHKYPAWVETLITTEGEVQKLKEKLEGVKERLTYPITILSLAEVKQLMTGESIEGNRVYPLNWKQYLQVSDFEKALKESEEKVEKVKKLRSEKEYEISEFTGLRKSVLDFLEAFSYEIYKSISEALDDIKKNLGCQKQELETKEDRRRELEVFLDSSQMKKEKLKEISQSLNDRVMKAHEYLRLKQEQRKLQVEWSEVRKDLAEEKRSYDQLLRTLTQVQSLIQDCKDELMRLKDKKNQVETDEIYREVQSLPILPIKNAQETLVSLKKVREALKKSLEKEQSSRYAIEEGIRERTRQKEALEKDIKRERKTAHYYDEVTLEYGIAEEKWFNDLVDRLPQLKYQKESTDKKVGKLKSLYDQAIGIYEGEKKRYEKDYEAVTVFIADTQIVRDEIGRKERETYLKHQQLINYKNKLLEERKLWQDQDELLKRKNEKYKFLAPDIKEVEMEESQRLEVEYAIQKATENLLSQLEESLEAYTSQDKKLSREKERFITFCNTEIKDVKLRSLAYQGVTGEKTYTQTLDWQSSLISRIEISIRYQEDAMIEHDKEMNQFVIHLYTHLSSIATELGQIYKKTKLKTEEGVKYFYDIVVPEWKEEESKIKLRNYINEIEQLIEKKYETEILDKEAQEEIKKFIANKFKVTQLMNVLIGIDKVKVRCRKAISMGNISTKLFSWEESNQWSGGEKWSKNMALFLGLLNYIAEKKQNIYTTNKVSRVVILDNPFGKASSTHVLEPVFFIASQLGFQIIALTAHGEGDFIRKYFPVIYSCKLRQTKDSSTTLIMAKQEVNKAYFREVSPAALGRLGQSE